MKIGIFIAKGTKCDVTLQEIIHMLQEDNIQLCETKSVTEVRHFCLRYSIDFLLYIVEKVDVEQLTIILKRTSIIGCLVYLPCHNLIMSIKSSEGRASLEIVRELKRRIRKYYNRYCVHFVEGAFYFLPERLAYVESRDHVCNFYMTLRRRAVEWDRYHAYVKLDDIEKMLEDEPFVRIHKGYLVNLRYVKEIRNQTAVLCNGMQLPISRSHRKNTVEKWRSYIYSLPAIL